MRATRAKKEASKSSKILVELSNSLDVENERISNAQRLKKLLDDNSKTADLDIQVVKAFNGISAYSMESSFSVQKSIETVPIAGGSVQAKDHLIRFCTQIGHQAYDAGSLESAALKLELMNNETFRDWQKPTLVSALFLLFNFVWIFVWYFYFPKKPHTFEQYMRGFALMGHLNKVLGFTSLHMLAFVYLGSPVAGAFQLAYGTKYRRFPATLDWCLRARKQLGLIAFLYAIFHMILSLLIANPAYFDNWYRVATTASAIVTMFTSPCWNGELAMITGVLGFVTMALVALSSVNSIASSLNWSEWQFVQSKLGLACLAISFTHTAIMYARFFTDKDYSSYTLIYRLSRVKGLGLIFPLLVLAIRFVFAYSPPISGRVDAIRNGSVASAPRSSKRDLIK